jgi:excisionase family DNA binding protein
MEITVKEAAKRLGLHPSRIRQLITEGKLPAKRPGKKVLLINELDLNLIEVNHRYSKTNPNPSPSSKLDDLIDIIKLQNSKIQTIEKELFKLKEKFLLAEENPLSSQHQGHLALPNLVTSPETNNLTSKVLAKSSEAINEPSASSLNVQAQRLLWLKANQENYKGKYLAFDQEKLVSTAPTYEEAKEAAIDLGVLKPFVVHVPDPNNVYHINW